MKNNLLVFVLLLSLLSCSKKSADLKNGKWRGVIHLQNQEVPFNFEISNDISGKRTVTLINAEERLKIDSITVKDDSLFIPMHIFDTEIRARISDDKLEGVFVKKYAQDYKLPFYAVFNSLDRFTKVARQRYLPKRFEIQFADEPDSIKAVGVIKNNGNRITGTVMTITGDHRFLEGTTTKDSIFLSTFDGEHVYLYKAKINPDSSLTGHYYSGKSYNTPFSAIPNDSIELKNENSLTYLKPGYDQFNFSFPGIDGKEVTNLDPKYQNKVVIVQILGSWCPNCMDETNFLSTWYKKNRDRGVEVIGLSYEKKDDFEYARKRISKLKERLGILYDIGFGGSSDKEEASKTLPMLNRVVAFPTTIFIDKKGKVQKIHTGFSGPGTGVYYEKFVDEFNATVNQLLKAN